MSSRYHAERTRRNHASKCHAEHDFEPWSAEEISLLMSEFPDANGNRADEFALAELLGRTVEACRQRFYEVRRGNAQTTRAKAPAAPAVAPYIGAADDPEDAWWSPSYYTKEDSA